MKRVGVVLSMEEINNISKHYVRDSLINKLLKYNIEIICIGKIKEKFFKDAIDEYKKNGFTKLRVNKEYLNIEDVSFEKNIKDNIDIVIDKLTIKPEERSRVFEAIETSCKLAGGKVVILADEEEIIMS